MAWTDRSRGLSLSLNGLAIATEARTTKPLVRNPNENVCLVYTMKVDLNFHIESSELVFQQKGSNIN